MNEAQEQSLNTRQNIDLRCLFPIELVKSSNTFTNITSNWMYFNAIQLSRVYEYYVFIIILYEYKQ